MKTIDYDYISKHTRDKHFLYYPLYYQTQKSFISTKLTM